MAMLWGRIFSSDTGIDIVSFNASLYDITLYYKDRKEKKIAWGIEEKENVKDWQTGDLLTSSCGMGGEEYREEDCKEQFNLLKKIASTLS